MLEKALTLSSNGIPVFPCSPDDKRPYTRNGFKAATTDEKQVREWWGKWPDAWVGVPTGAIVALDLDAKHQFGLARQFEQAAQKSGIDLSGLPKQFTPTGGGVHYLFRTESEIRNRTYARNANGDTIIETRGNGGYIIAYDTEAIIRSPMLSDGQIGALLRLAESFCKIGRKSEVASVLPTPSSQPSGESPGDDYNFRGDIFAVLKKHGWHQVGKQQWRRPGKDHGISATWDKVPGKFYVFSSNAFPFEPNKSYSPFAVYAVLECGGDFAEAARRLRDEGYGEEMKPDPEAKAIAEAVIAEFEAKQKELTSRVEALESISRKSTPAASTYENKPPPRSLLSPPGMMGELARWIEANAYMPQPWLSVGAALAIMSVLCGRQYSYSGQRSNLFIISSAPSSSGKENGRRCIKTLFHEAGCMDLLGHEDVSSDKAILTVVKERGRVLFPWDEIGHIFLANKQARDSAHLQKIIPTLMTLYSSAGATYMGRAYANSEDNLDPIDDPHVCIYGTTTPAMLKEAFSTEDAKSGWMGRVLFFQSLDEPPPPEDFHQVPPSEDLIKFVREVYRYEVAGNLGEILPGRPPAHVQELSCTNEAKAVLRALQLEFYAQKKREESESTKGLIGKAYEMALRVCICVAVGCNPEKPKITKPIAEWVSEFMRYLLGECLAIAYHNTGTQMDERCDRVLAEIRKAGEIRRQDLLRGCRGITSKDLTSITAELIDRGEISSETVPNPKGAGRPIQVFAISGK